jgi:peptide/nickel transport system substrate-binding protein
VVVRILSQPALNAALQGGTIDSTTWGSLDATQLPSYARLHTYALVTAPASPSKEVLYFNFHNQVLASHLEVRQAIADAIDYQALRTYENALQPEVPKVYPLCTDHSSFYHPGFDPTAPCPLFEPAAANQVLDNNGWVKGPDGVRTRGGQRLEFEFSAPIGGEDRIGLEAIIQRDLQAIGIKLDILNYPETIFFSSFTGQASPPTGAVAGRFDMYLLSNTSALDPDDSILLACNQFWPNGSNFDYYCNPALDALYQQELTTPDPGVRQNIFVQIHLIYLTQFPFIVLFGQYGGTYIVRKGTHNFLPNYFFGSTEYIWQWWCTNARC